MKSIGRKVSLLLGVAAFSLMLAACSQSGGSSSSQKIAVVDMSVLSQSPAVQKLGAQLMAGGADQSKLKAAYQEVMALQNQLASAKTDADKKALQAKVDSQKAAFSAMMQNAQQQQAQQEHAMQSKIDTAIANVADKEGASYVYVKQAILYGNVDDITDKVVKALS